MGKPTLSICIVTYNHADYIEGCVMSVISQSAGVNLEILVGVDQSTDGTLEIVKRLASQYPETVRCIAHSERLGYGSKNYQILIAQAEGEFIAHLDGDDYWLPGKLGAQLDFMNSHPDCPAVYTNAVVINGRGSQIGLFTTAQPQEISLDYLVERGNFLNQSSMLYRATVSHLILDLDAPFLDYHVNLLLAEKGNLGFVSTPLTVYRYDAPQSVRVRNNESVRQLYWRAIMSMEGSHVSEKAMLCGKAEMLRQVFFRSIKYGDLSLFLDWWGKIAVTERKHRINLVVLLVTAITRRVYIELRGLLQQKGILKGNRVLYAR